MSKLFFLVFVVISTFSCASNQKTSREVASDNQPYYKDLRINADSAQSLNSLKKNVLNKKLTTWDRDNKKLISYEPKNMDNQTDADVNSLVDKGCGRISNKKAAQVASLFFKNEFISQDFKREIEKNQNHVCVLFHNIDGSGLYVGYMTNQNTRELAYSEVTVFDFED